MTDTTETSDHINPHDRRFTVNHDDETTVALRAKVAGLLQPPVNPKAAAFWQDILADHIRNQHRVKRGLPPIVERWDRGAPENVVTLVREARVAS